MLSGKSYDLRLNRPRAVPACVFCEHFSAKSSSNGKKLVDRSLFIQLRACVRRAFVHARIKEDLGEIGDPVH